MLGAELAKGITPLDFSLRSTLHSQLGIETQTNASFKLDWRQSRGNATTLTTFQKCVGCVRAKIGMQMIGKLLLLWMAIERIRFPLCGGQAATWSYVLPCLMIPARRSPGQRWQECTWVILHRSPHRSCRGAHLGLLPLLFANLWASEYVDRGAIG